MAETKANQDIQKRIDRLLSGTMQSEDDKKLSQAQLDKLKEWTEYYQAMPSKKGGSIKPASVWSSLFRLRDLALFINKPFEEATTQDILNFYKTKFTAKQVTSRAGSKVVIRQFYAWMDKFNIVDDPRLKPDNTKKVKVTPKDLPSKDEILSLLKACPDYRSKSIIWLCYGEAGLRAGEIVTLTRDSLEFDQYGAKLWINKSKSTERYTRLVDTEPYLRRYIELEYSLEGDTSTLPLFYGLHRFKGKWLLPSAINQVINRAQKKAGITRRLWCHGGRHASITRCYKDGMDVDTIAQRHGITAQTVRNVYLHFDDKDADEAYLKIKGKLSTEKTAEMEKEEKKLSYKDCPRCKERNGADGKFCTRCSMALDIETAYEVTEYEKKKSDVATGLLEEGIDLNSQEGKLRALQLIKKLEAEILIES